MLTRFRLSFLISHQTRGRREPVLSLEIQDLLGDGNMLYVNQNYVDAIKVFQNIITLEPNVHVAWTTLATCYEELKYEEKALQCEMVAAYLRPSAETWKELGARSR